MSFLFIKKKMLLTYMINNSCWLNQPIPFTDLVTVQSGHIRMSVVHVSICHTVSNSYQILQQITYNRVVYITRRTLITYITLTDVNLLLYKVTHYQEMCTNILLYLIMYLQYSFLNLCS